MKSVTLHRKTGRAATISNIGTCARTWDSARRRTRFSTGNGFSTRARCGSFLSGAAPCPEEDPQCPAGSFFEYAMLRLRLCEGLTEAGCNARFGHGIPELLRRRAARYVPAGLLKLDETRLSLTRLGFLVSNTLLEELLEPFFL